MAQERDEAESRLALLELLQAAQERRYEVVEAVWDARDEAEAVERLHRLLGVPADPRVVLDMRLGRLTAEGRERLREEADDLRRRLGAR